MSETITYDPMSYTNSEVLSSHQVALPVRTDVSIGTTVKRDPFTKGYHFLTNFQEEILLEAYEKQSGGLALPMGTGKTFISLLLAVMLRQNESKYSNPILVVASKTLLNDWEKELKYFFGDQIRYQILHQEHIKSEDISSWTPFPYKSIVDNSIVEGYDVVLTTPQFLAKYYKYYGLVNRFVYYTMDNNFGPEVKNYKTADQPLVNYNIGPEIIYSIVWSVLIVDEAHTYCNIKTDRCLAIASICAEFRWLLSGTMFDEPKIEKIMGYYLLLNYKPFPRNLPECNKFITDKNSDYKGSKVTLVHREKNEDYNIDELKINVNKVIISHSLGAEESKIYTNIKSVLNILKKKLDEYKAAGDRINIRRFSSYVLGMISYLRQCLICPLIPITTVAINIADFDRKSELSEIFMENIKSLEIDDWLNNPNAICSSRIQAVIKQTNKHLSQRIVIFSCYRTVLNILSYYIGNYREQFTISGNNKIEKRKKVLDSFEKSNNGLLLLTYEIGGNGINLQCSDTVMLVDFWWNSGKSEQAISRILRRGQKSNAINIYYFTANTGMENAVFKIQESKKKVANELLNGHIESCIHKTEKNDILKLINKQDNIDILSSISNY